MTYVTSSLYVVVILYALVVDTADDAAPLGLALAVGHRTDMGVQQDAGQRLT